MNHNSINGNGHLKIFNLDICDFIYYKLRKGEMFIIIVEILLLFLLGSTMLESSQDNILLLSIPSTTFHSPPASKNFRTISIHLPDGWGREKKQQNTVVTVGSKSFSHCVFPFS